MEPWGPPLYGDPCRECGFSWALTRADAVGMVAGVTDRLQVALADADGRAQRPDLDWNVAAYVAHIADNLRIWSEQFGGVMAGGDPHVPGYDEQLLARARHYNDIPLASGLWALRQSVAVWVPTITAALAADVVLLHAGRGRHRAAEVVLSNAHDVFHHAWDIARSQAGPG